jgi:hypothetical protein
MSIASENDPEVFAVDAIGNGAQAAGCRSTPLVKYPT